jgi:hypothetical protein
MPTVYFKSVVSHTPTGVSPLRSISMSTYVKMGLPSSSAWSWPVNTAAREG